MNSALEAIERQNKASLERIAAFQQDHRDRTATWDDFSTLKHEHPYIGLVPCTARGIDFALFHVNDDQVAWEYQWYGSDAYEPDVITAWVDWCRDNQPDEIYDIGGYTGLFSILAAKACPGATVHLFEPMGRTIERAKINVRTNMVGRQVKLHNQAASDEAGRTEISLYREENFLGSGNSIDQKGIPVADVKVIDRARIDDELPNGRPGVVKIDVEGHEVACLRGMAATIERARPHMIVEVWKQNREEVHALLDGWGYTYTRFELEERRVVNYWCMPVEASSALAEPGPPRRQGLWRRARTIEG